MDQSHVMSHSSFIKINYIDDLLLKVVGFSLLPINQGEIQQGLPLFQHQLMYVILL